MNGPQAFEPSFAAYLGYCSTFFVRYFAVGGLALLVLQVAFRRTWQAYRIQEPYPKLTDIGREMAWTVLNTACTGLTTILLYQLIHTGHSAMYFDVAARGWIYFAASVVLGIVAYDAWFYWQHRLLHTPWLFAHAHSVHHRSVNPTAFAAYAHHPIETFMGNAFFVLFVVLVPLHPLAFAAVGFYLYLTATIAHLGYEFYPRGFVHHRFFGWWNTSTHHNMHHSGGACNYSICFNFWDRLLGTLHADYEARFDAVTARRAHAAILATRRESAATEATPLSAA